MMTRKERFLTAVRGRQPDRLPMFDFLFQQPLYEALIGHRPRNYNARDAVTCALALDHDAVWLPFGGYVLASDHSLHDGIPLANIRTMFRVGREYGGRCYANPSTGTS